MGAGDVLPPWRGHQLDAGPFRLHVRRAGPAATDADVAVLVHGLGGASTNWTDLMGELRDRLDLWAPDLPGFGRSDPPPGGDYRPAAHADAVAALIEAVGAPVHLVGNSLGGAVVTRVAALRPELVRTLTLVSPAFPTYRPRRTNIHLPAIAVPGVGEVLMRRFARVPAEHRVAASLRAMYADPAVVPPQRVAEAVAELERRSGLGHADLAVLASLRGLLAEQLRPGETSPWRLARRVHAPTLVIHGDRDGIIPLPTGRRVARTIPGSRLVVLPRCGHVAQMERPREVARLVAEHAGLGVASSY
ncbi:MAG: alpha/beta fold hydrolase [Actinomycetota bacterium]|nr:alpha/beta fold hydrolase [Actinomycetota bacterium]